MSKTSYAPGETVTVTMTGGYRQGWVRGFLLDQNLNEIDRSTCPGGTGNCSTSASPITLAAPAPSTPGTYTWAVAWYGNYAVEKSGESYGSGTSVVLQPGYFTPDSTNPDHGYQTVSLPSFTVTQPAAPSIALNPASLAFGTVTLGNIATMTTQIQNTGNATLTISSIALCSGTPARFTWAPSTTPFSVAAGGSTTLTVTYTPTTATTDSGCLAVASNDTAKPTVNLAVTGTGQTPAAPKIAVSPTTLAFGNVTVGTTSAMSFTVSNTGNASLTGTVALGTGTSSQYSITPTTFNVAQGGSVSIAVAFSPTAAGAANGSLVVASNDPTNPSVTVGVTGAGVAAPAPNIALNPTSLAFGTVTIGGQVSLSAQVQNLGTAPLNVTSIALCSGTPARFAWSPAAPFTVAPNGSTSLTVTYTPTVAVTDSGCLALSSNDTAKPTVNLNVSGAGQAASAPRIAVSPTSLDFGTVTVGTPLSRTFTVTNTGTAQLSGTLALAGTSSADFAFSPTAFSLAPSGSQTVNVTYQPTTAAPASGSIVVTSNDSASPTVSVSLSGTGVSTPVATIALSPSALDFGSVTVSTSATLTAQIRNTGTAPLDVSSIGLCSGTSSAFAWSPAAPFSVAPGQATTLTVTFSPTLEGSTAGCLTVASSDLAHPSVQLTLTGAGVAPGAPAIALEPPSVDLGSVAEGNSVSKTTLVRNSGTATLTVSAISLCTGTSSVFTWAPTAPFSVSPGQSQTLTVTYRPTTVGTDTGCLAISSNVAASPTVSLAVSGTATAPPTAGLDVDIVRLGAPHHVLSRSTSKLNPFLDVLNAGTVSGTVSATLVGAIDGKEVYREIVSITLDAGGKSRVSFPAYVVPQRPRGVLLWTATLVDQDSDLDRATARTIFGRGEIDDSSGDEREDSKASSDDSDNSVSHWEDHGKSSPGVSQAALTAAGTTASGCTSTGASFPGLLFLVPLALSALRRRTTRGKRA